MIISQVALIVFCLGSFISLCTSDECDCPSPIEDDNKLMILRPGGVCEWCHEKHILISGFSVGNNLQMEILSSFNIGVRNESSNDTDVIFQNNTIVGKCRYCSLFPDNVYAVSNRVLLYTNNSFRNLCKPHATGFLCGKCEEGYHHNMGQSCVKCNNITLNWFIYILSQFLSITVMFVILFLTNFSLVSGPLNASLFFAQMVSTTMDLDQDLFPLANITNSTDVAYHLTSVYKFIYGPWNLNFFAPYINKVCLFKTDSFLYYFILEYIVALYPLLLVSGVGFIYFLKNRNTTIVEKCKHRFYCCYRLLPNNLHQSSRNVLASFVFLAYVKFSWLTTILLTPNPLYDFLGENAGYVLYLDPNINSNSVGIVLFGVVCTIFIILLPTFLFFFRFNYVPKYLSFLSDLLEPFQYPFMRRKTIQDNLLEEHTRFQACWKHIKRYEYTWVASIYFILRILLLIVFLSFEDFIKRFVCQQVVCLLGSMFFIFARPHAKEWNNKLDAILFLILAFINTLSMYQYYLASQSLSLNPIVFGIQYILIFVPFMWMSVYITYYFRKHCSCRKGVINLAHSDIYNRSAIVMTESSSVHTNAIVHHEEKTEYGTL